MIESIGKPQADLTIERAGIMRISHSRCMERVPPCTPPHFVHKRDVYPFDSLTGTQSDQSFGSGIPYFDT